MKSYPKCAANLFELGVHATIDLKMSEQELFEYLVQQEMSKLRAEMAGVTNAPTAPSQRLSAGYTPLNSFAAAAAIDAPAPTSGAFASRQSRYSPISVDTPG